MKRCVTCSGLLSESNFPDDSPICRACISKLKRDYAVDFSPPTHKTVPRAYVDLLVAVHDRAVEEGEIEDWNAYWLGTDPWAGLWEMIRTAHAWGRDVRAGSVAHTTTRKKSLS